MSTQYEIFKHFGLKPEKRKDLVKGKTFQRTREIIISGIYDAGWLAIAGQIGSGKTETSYAVLDELQDKSSYRVVEVFSPDRAGIKISHMLNSIIYQLGEEFINRKSPRRDKEARTMQTLNILASAKKKGIHVILVVDEAQELHHMTIKAMKRLHEYRFMGERDMLTILMIGQEGLAASVERDDEVRPRCDLFEFSYTQAELGAIARHHSFGMLTKELEMHIAAVYQTPLEIKSAIYEAMRKAYRIGSESLNIKHFDFPEQAQQKEAPARDKITIGSAEKVNESLKNAS